MPVLSNTKHWACFWLELQYLQRHSCILQDFQVFNSGRDEGEDTQVELVLLEHSFEQVELTAIPLFDCTCYFQRLWLLLKIKEHHSSF